MFGASSYGKPVDIWAIGFVMYELICGKHPLWVKGEDRLSYQDKLKKFQKLTFQSSKFSPLAINLIEKLCHQKPSARYKVEQALTHPWITRDLEGKIPRTVFEENIYIYELEAKFRKV